MKERPGNPGSIPSQRLAELASSHGDGHDGDVVHVGTTLEKFQGLSLIELYGYRLNPFIFSSAQDDYGGRSF